MYIRLKLCILIDITASFLEDALMRTHQVEIELYTQLASVQVVNNYLCKHKNYFGRLKMDDSM